MTPDAALIELLARVGAGDGAPVRVSEYELNQWPGVAVAAMKTQRLLAKARTATGVICPGCEDECWMPVHVPPNAKGIPAAFIVCDKRSDIGRVPVSVDCLLQWQCSGEAVCALAADSLGLRRSTQPSSTALQWNIGIVCGNKRSQMLCLHSAGVLSLVAGSNALPLAEVIGFADGAYSLDDVRVRQLVDAASTADNRYTPSNAKREARKLDTQAMYAGWQKAYRDLQRRRSGMSDVWYSQQIEKLAEACGRNAETIRKHMKK